MDEAAFIGGDDSLDAVPDAEFCQHAAHVGLHGLQTEHQFGCDLGSKVRVFGGRVQAPSRCRPSITRERDSAPGRGRLTGMPAPARRRRRMQSKALSQLPETTLYCTHSVPDRDELAWAVTAKSRAKDRAT